MADKENDNTNNTRSGPKKTGFQIGRFFGSIARYETRVKPVDDQGWTYLNRNQSANSSNVCMKAKTEWWLVGVTPSEIESAN